MFKFVGVLALGFRPTHSLKAGMAFGGLSFRGLGFMLSQFGQARRGFHRFESGFRV